MVKVSQSQTPSELWEGQHAQSKERHRAPWVNWWPWSRRGWDPKRWALWLLTSSTQFNKYLFTLILYILGARSMKKNENKFFWPWGSQGLTGLNVKEQGWRRWRRVLGRKPGVQRQRKREWWSEFAWVVHKASHTGREPTVMLFN